MVGSRDDGGLHPTSNFGKPMGGHGRKDRQRFPGGAGTREDLAAEGIQADLIRRQTAVGRQPPALLL